MRLFIVPLVSVHVPPSELGARSVAGEITRMKVIEHIPGMTDTQLATCGATMTRALSTGRHDGPEAQSVSVLEGASMRRSERDKMTPNARTMAERRARSADDKPATKPRSRKNGRRSHRPRRDAA